MTHTTLDIAETDYQIVTEYMDNKYPNKIYTIKQGNNCVWVSTFFPLVNMYFIVRDNKIADIQID